LVEPHAEDACRRVRLEHRNRIFRDLPGRRIELSKNLFPEARVPDRALRIHDRVVRLPRAFRQVVLAVDDLRGVAARAWERLERVSPLRAGTQIDVAQKFGLSMPPFEATVRRW